MSRELSTRFLSGFLSLSLHAAAGVALLWAWDEGAPMRDRSGGDGGSVLVVELIPLDRVQGLAGQDTAPGGESTEPLSEPQPPMNPGRVADVSPVQRAAGPLSGAAQATAETQGEPREVADVSGADLMAYRQRLEAHLARYRIYPQAAREAGREGVVMLHFVMTDDGKVLQAWVGESSGVSDIDREAVAAILRAQPLPAFPHGWPGRLTVALPVTFRLG